MMPRRVQFLIIVFLSLILSISFVHFMAEGNWRGSGAVANSPCGLLVILFLILVAAGAGVVWWDELQTGPTRRGVGRVEEKPDE